MAQAARRSERSGDVRVIPDAVRELRYASAICAPYLRTSASSIFGSRARPSKPETSSAEFGKKISAAGAWSSRRRHRHHACRETRGGTEKQLRRQHPHLGTNANSIIAEERSHHLFKTFSRSKLIFIATRTPSCYPGRFRGRWTKYEAFTLMQTGKSQLMPPSSSWTNRTARIGRRGTGNIANISCAGQIDFAGCLNLYRSPTTPMKRENRSRFYRNFDSTRLIRNSSSSAEKCRQRLSLAPE